MNAFALRNLKFASVLLASIGWHLWRVATIRPVLGALGANIRTEIMVFAMFFAAGLLRHHYLSEEPKSIMVTGISLLFWLAVVSFVVQSVLIVSVRFFPSEADEKQFVISAAFTALTCSVVVDLLVSSMVIVFGTKVADYSAVFLVSEMTLIALNVYSLHEQALKTRRATRIQPH